MKKTNATQNKGIEHPKHLDEKNECNTGQIRVNPDKANKIEYNPPPNQVKPGCKPYPD